MSKKADMSPRAYAKMKIQSAVWWKTYGSTIGKAYGEARKFRRYGLTPEQFQEMLASQGGVCAICKGPQVGGKKALSIDHDRKCCPRLGSCGKCVRGLLCFSCNTSLGTVETFTEKAQEYLRWTSHDTDASGSIDRSDVA